MNRFIVKVQISITTTEPVRQALINNKEGTIVEIFDAPKDLIKRVGNHPLFGPKRFFWAHIDKDRQLVIDENAPDQDW